MSDDLCAGMAERFDLFFSSEFGEYDEEYIAFFSVEFYGGFDLSPYDRDTSRRLITIARQTRR